MFAQHVEIHTHTHTPLNHLSPNSFSKVFSETSSPTCWRRETRPSSAVRSKVSELRPSWTLRLSNIPKVVFTFNNRFSIVFEHNNSFMNFFYPISFTQNWFHHHNKHILKCYLKSKQTHRHLDRKCKTCNYKRSHFSRWQWSSGSEFSQIHQHQGHTTQQ